MADKKLPKGITLRRDGRYMARFQYEGESYTLYDTDLEKLQQSMEDLKYEVRHGIYAKESNVTFDSWFQTWMQEYKKDSVKCSTYDLYDRTYDGHIKKYFKGKKIKNIRPEHIQKMLNAEAKIVMKQTLTRIFVLLGGSFRQAYKNGIINKNPMDRVTLPRGKEDRSERRVMTRDEQNLFMEYANRFPYGDIFETALSTGMRNGELRALEWSDIDFEKKVIHVTGTLIYSNGQYTKGTPKSRTSERDIPMLDNVYRIMKQRKKQQLELKMLLGNMYTPTEGLENLVFTNEFGGVIKHVTIQYYMRHIQETIEKEKIKWERIHVHTLRHTFATRAIESGMEPQVLKTILGHSSLAMTMDLYSHVLPNTKQEEMQKLANLF